MRLSRISLLSCALSCAAVWSCGALIGEKDIFLAEGADAGPSGGDGGGGGPDGNTGAKDGAMSSDGSTTCADTMTNPLHCGKCNHSCLGGQCMAGQCQPIALVKDQSTRDLAVDKNHVYWIEPNTARAWQANKDGTGTIQLGGGTQNLLEGLAIDDASVFWGSLDGLVLRCAIGGCTNAPTQVTAQATSISAVAVDATNVYWLENPSGPARVRKASKTGTANAATTIAADTAGAPAGSFNRIAADGTYIYWTADDGKVRRVLPTGGQVDVIGMNTGNALGLAINGSTVFWTDGATPGAIYSAPKAGGSAGSPLVAQQNLTIGVAVDQTSLYWVNAALGLSQNSGVVMTCTIAACTPKPLAMNQHSPVAIVVDDVAIYWSNFDSGNNMGGIMKLAK